MTALPPPAPLSQTLRGLRYTKKAYDTAVAKHEFIHVSSTGSASKRHITGAPKIWAKPGSENEIYNLQYRISGSPADIMLALLPTGVSEAQINASNAQYGVTRLNYQTTMKAAYDAEVAAYKQYSMTSKAKKVEEGKEKPSRQAILANIRWWGENIDKAQLVNKSTSQIVSGPSGKGSRNVLLSVKFQEAVGKGKYLNLTKWNPSSFPNATGVRMVDPPTAKSRQFFVGGLPFVVDKNEAGKILVAVEKLGLNNDPNYATAVKSLQQFLASTSGARPASVGFAPSNLPFIPTGVPLTRQ